MLTSVISIVYVPNYDRIGELFFPPVGISRGNSFPFNPVPETYGGMKAKLLSTQNFAGFAAKFPPVSPWCEGKTFPSGK
jgi:hypothetical protein